MVFSYCLLNLGLFQGNHVAAVWSRLCLDVIGDFESCFPPGFGLGMDITAGHVIVGFVVG